MSIGKLSEFDIHKDDWMLYVDRLEQYFLVNNVSNELRVPTLITVMGAESYELLVNLCTPEKPSTKSFHQITQIMEKHLQPRPSELAERYKFRHRKQHNDEKISEYVAILKKMSKTCNFGSGLEESLRDQFVCGISSEIIRQRLFAEKGLDFVKAYNMAVSMEAAEKDAAIVQGHGRSSDTVISADCQVITRATRISSYHPSSNGAAENAVKLCKRAIKKAIRDKVDVDTALQTFLLGYRNTIHCTTGETPAMLLQRRTLRSRLDLLRTNRAIENKVYAAQDRQIRNAGGVERNLTPGEPVWAKGFSSQDKWIKGKVNDREGSNRYVLEGDNGQLFKRHIDQIRRRSHMSDVICPDNSCEIDTKNGGEDDIGDAREEVDVSKGSTERNVSPVKEFEAKGATAIERNNDTDTSTHHPPQIIPEPRYPQRVRKPVVRFGLEFD